MSRFIDKVAIITGAAGGIGSAAARRLVAEGARVMLVDLDESALQELSTELGSATRWCRADVSNADDCQNYLQQTLDNWEKLDVLLANAGIEGVVKPLHEYPNEIFNKVMQVNVHGVWNALQQAMPVMAKTGGGSIVITSSVAGLQGAAGMSAYVTSKHAVVGLMRSAAIEGAPHNVRVNTVNPAPIETRMMRSLEREMSAENPEAVHDQLGQAIPFGRYGSAEEVASMLLYLGSEDSSYCTGGTYTVDGAMSSG
ncbi:MAG: oxidoreductase [Gammaproteobacteria bacterium]|nr:MAG: oxidoreductase [Gammaproteobacteria bacterium]RLA11177.1 MAG: oxidoreductase [Gammaproteobacteria bacterium]RLA17098.1 MAG: oxidoreductase [Gammaproteobacteria bacterium]